MKCHARSAPWAPSRRLCLSLNWSRRHAEPPDEICCPWFPRFCLAPFPGTIPDISTTCGGTYRASWSHNSGWWTTLAPLPTLLAVKGVVESNRSAEYMHYCMSSVLQNSGVRGCSCAARGTGAPWHQPQTPEYWNTWYKLTLWFVAASSALFMAWTRSTDSHLLAFSSPPIASKISSDDIITSRFVV